MKKLLRNLLLIAILTLSVSIRAAEELPAYYHVAHLNVSIEDASGQVIDALGSKNFEIVGQYHPAGKQSLFVIAFTRPDLQKEVLKVKDRGALASVLKVGLVSKDGGTDVSLLNPEYIFYAYLMDETEKHLGALNIVIDDVKAALKNVGVDFTPFGGGEEADDLKDYHYMMMMPYFTDPVKLKTFDSFEQGLEVIRKNLAAKKGNTEKVYEVVYKNEKVAVFGIGLLDKEDGEAFFLPIIGEDHVAAMPYEIILQGKEATMLHGKYRLALHWPTLSMGQFMKISGTPGDVEDFLKALTE